MKEMKRISKLFSDLYDGDPWLGVTIAGTLNGITAEQAARKVGPRWNTIWEIVNHVIDWRLNVLQRVQGDAIVTPDNNYFEPVPDVSEEAWRRTLHRLGESQEDWLEMLKKFKKNELDNEYPSNHMSYYEHMQGIIQHDAYHLGQIVLLAKAL
jgi:uncharacterized damage-inducible protein DinB